MSRATRIVRLPLIALLCALWLPCASAAAQSNGSDCSYTQDDGSTPDQSVYTEIEGSTNGLSGQAGPVVGACVDAPTPQGGPAHVEGGSVEAGADSQNPSEAYVVADGDNENSDPTGQSDGYAGASTHETGTKGGCTGGGTGTNSGGCVSGGGQTVNNSASPLVCGNERGNTWASSTQDGCELPVGGPPPTYPCTAGVGSVTAPYQWISPNCPVGVTPIPPTYGCQTGVGTPMLVYEWISPNCPVGVIPVPPLPPLYGCTTGVGSVTAPYFWISPSCPVGVVPLPPQCTGQIGPITFPYPSPGVIWACPIAPMFTYECQTTVGPLTVPYYWTSWDCDPRPTIKEFDCTLIEIGDVRVTYPDLLFGGRCRPEQEVSRTRQVASG
jgi:hypothetical protein